MNPYKDGPAQSYDGIIVRVQKNAAAMQVLTVFTVQKGLIRLFAGTAKKTGKRSGSPFFFLPRFLLKRTKKTAYTTWANIFVITFASSWN